MAIVNFTLGAFNLLPGFPSPVSEIMTPKDKLQSVLLDADGVQILKSLTTRDVHQVPVMDGDKVAAMICRSDILRVLQLKSELGV